MRNPVLSWLAFAVGFGAMFFLGIATAGESYVTGRMASGNSVPIYFEDVDGQTRAYVRPAVGKPIVLKPDNPVRLSSLVDAQGNIRGTATRNALVPAETGWKGANRLAVIDDIKIPRGSAVAAASTAARLFGAAGLVLGAVEGLQALDAYFDENDQTWKIQEPPCTQWSMIKSSWEVAGYGCSAPEACLDATASYSMNRQCGIHGTQTSTVEVTSTWVVDETVQNDGFCRMQRAVSATTGCNAFSSTAEHNPVTTGVVTEGEIYPATDQDLETRIDQYFDENPFDVWESVQQSGVDVEIPDDAEATLTPTVPTMETQPVTRTTTITNPDGSTTERVESTHQRLTIGSQGATMATNTITYNVTNITTITEDGDVVEYSETTIDQPEAPPAPAQTTEESEPETFAPPGSDWPPLDEAPKFDESMGRFFTEIQQTELVLAMTLAAENIPDGSLSCVPPSFMWNNQEFIFSEMCELYTAYAPMLRAFFILGWAIFAVVLFMKA